MTFRFERYNLIYNFYIITFFSQIRPKLRRNHNKCESVIMVHVEKKKWISKGGFKNTLFYALSKWKGPVNKEVTFLRKLENVKMQLNLKSLLTIPVEKK